MTRRYLLVSTAGLLLACSLLVAPASSPTPDLFATLQALTPSGAYSPVPPAPTATSAFNFPSPVANTPTIQVSVPTFSSPDQPTGHIVFTCQIFKTQYADQICMMNADGSGYKRLTTDDGRRHYYPSFSPDGKSIVYSSFREENVYEIYELELADGSVNRLTNRLGVSNAPEVSPDGQSIVFMRWTQASNQYQIWLMDRNGENAGNISRTLGWDPTWSPDGRHILFASDRDGSNQLYAVNTNGKGLVRITNLPSIRGRSDWSPDGQFIVTYSGEPWRREIYIMNADGSGARVLSPTGGNSQGPAFSPDGKWIAFTAYFDHPNDDHGCEIYIIRIDGTDLRRLTDNDYCDYQPRWGP